MIGWGGGGNFFLRGGQIVSIAMHFSLVAHLRRCTSIYLGSFPFLYVYGIQNRTDEMGPGTDKTMHVPDLFPPNPDQILDPASVFPKVMRRTAMSTHTRGHPKPFTARNIEVLTSKSWIYIGCGRDLRGTRTLTVNVTKLLGNR
jgi:hypothetical protein